MKFTILFLALIDSILSFKVFSCNRLARFQVDETNVARVRLHQTALDDSRVELIELNEEMKNSFISYAMSTILGRALPDARDGLKPVHRRVLFAMNSLNLNPESSYRKCARIVGEVLGKFHPHGDQSVYEALVRMAQDFVLSHPLVSGHGNFGSIDNDPAAAMRYTEAKLSNVACDCLLSDIKENTVDFVPNFDGNEVEPLVLPAKFPMLLLGGSSGIAVGMATNIPPHNFQELANVILALLENPELSNEDLCKILPAPDFPTGGYIIGNSGARELYTTGHGSIVMRAKCHIEVISSNTKAGASRSKNAIIVSELPYQTNKAALLEKIAAMVNEKKLEGISDLRDESDRDGVRVVIELKRDAVPNIVLNNLFKKTALQTNFAANMIALVDNGKQPQRMSLKTYFKIFIDFRYETLRRRTSFQLKKVDSRLHIVDGLLIALSKMDQIIEIVRKAKDQTEAVQKLSSKEFNLTSDQTEAILGLRLGRLTRLEDKKLQEEKKTLKNSSKYFQSLLQNDSLMFDLMRNETLELKQKYGIPRRTEIVLEDSEIKEEDLLANDRSVILLTKSGYIKRVPIMEFEAQSRGGRGKAGIRLPSTLTRQTSSSAAVAASALTSASPASISLSMINGLDDDESSSTEKGSVPSDAVTHFFSCNDHDKVIFITDRGIAYSVSAFKIPQASRTARGVPLPQVLPIQAEDRVTSVIPVTNFKDSSPGSPPVDELDDAILGPEPPDDADGVEEEPEDLDDAIDGDGDEEDEEEDLVDENDPSVTEEGDSLVLLTSHGIVKKTPLSAFKQISARGKYIITLSEGDSLKWARRCQPGDEVVIATKDGFASRFSTSHLGSTGRRSRGVRALRLREGDEMADIDIISAGLTKSKEQLYLLAVTQRGFGKRMLVDEFRTQRRGCKGCIAIKFKAKVGGGGKASRAEGKSRSEADAVSCMRVCRAGDDVVLSTARGTVIRQSVDQVSVQSRTATGVLLQRLDKDDLITMVDIVPPAAASTSEDPLINIAVGRPPLDDSQSGHVVENNSLTKKSKKV